MTSKDNKTMGVDTSDALRIVQNTSVESTVLLRQLHVWLGLGSAGGAVALVSLSTNLPDPALALRFFLPSLWSFLLGVIAAGASIFFLALRGEAFGQHYAAAHNRSALNDHIGTIPEVISSPARIANEANRKRDQLIERSKSEHGLAELAWKVQRRYRLAWAICLALSATSFVAGFAWPLIQLSVFGRGPLAP
jgi:zinc transporter ZupT